MDDSTREGLCEAGSGVLTAAVALGAAGLAGVVTFWTVFEASGGKPAWTPAPERFFELVFSIPPLAAVGAAAAVVALGGRTPRRRRGGRVVATAALVGVLAAGGTALSPVSGRAAFPFGPLLAGVAAGALVGAALLRRGTPA